MSRFDQLTLELINRPSISEDERLGLAELQLQRAQRMHWLMVGDNAEESDVIQSFTNIRNSSLDTLQKKRESQKVAKQQEAEARQLTELIKKQQQQQDQSGSIHQDESGSGDVLIQSNEMPSKKDTFSRTPTPGMTPTEKNSVTSPVKEGSEEKTPANDTQ